MKRGREKSDLPKRLYSYRTKKRLTLKAAELYFVLLVLIAGSALSVAVHSPRYGGLSTSSTSSSSTSTSSTGSTRGQGCYGPTCGVFFGSSQGPINIGTISAEKAWLMPAQRLFSTTYSSNYEFNTTITGSVPVIGYNMQPGTVIQLGLYINGQLIASRSIDVTESQIAQSRSAVIVGNRLGDVANFTGST